ncbi:hypothetical protein DFH06DRAFT_190361 [Mycena polygramma]|nr:hypothetical protein DFH06DRAFT_190361 [Mycena polygramma]
MRCAQPGRVQRREKGPLPLAELPRSTMRSGSSSAAQAVKTTQEADEDGRTIPDSTLALAQQHESTPCKAGQFRRTSRYAESAKFGEALTHGRAQAAQRLPDPPHHAARREGHPSSQKNVAISPRCGQHATIFSHGGRRPRSARYEDIVDVGCTKRKPTSPSYCAPRGPFPEKRGGNKNKKGGEKREPRRIASHGTRHRRPLHTVE